MRRVVVTGLGCVTGLGNNWQDIKHNMQLKKTAIKHMPMWSDIKGLNTQLGGPVVGFELPKYYLRKQTRSMGRVAQLATVSAEAALIDAKLIHDEIVLTSGRCGIAYGSCSGSTGPISDLSRIATEREVKNVTATTYVKLMSHTCAVNIALFFGLTGRVIPTSSACTSGSQAIGYAFEAIQQGKADVMLAGGAEELCPSQVAIFDTLYATSLKNDQPQTTPSPFDKNRDGLVIGEGAGTLILEELSHAQRRGAPIYGEIIGFGTNCDARHITQPTAKMMQKAIELALMDAHLEVEKIGYISAHGTATDRGDIAESQATYALFSQNVPISSLKGYYGHTLGACGAVEAILTLYMMHDGLFMPTANLNEVDPQCAPLDYIMDKPRQLAINYFMSNNFAFGGINTSLIFKREI
ncbi:beta-ketoacyl-ACP synthase [Thiotrichales bacterium 19S3-7]|nr:beta-ketoacyl-ACP synthase [Thiotrichales bacterium 19S3-7]MCF6802868.1 beta-ketoacyl-ACP synthase [Thiotrichales bacterium 19S3-11]